MEKKKNLLTIILIIIIILLLGIIAYLFFNKKEEAKTANSQSVSVTDKSCEKECDCSNTSYLGEKIQSLEEIKLSENNQDVKIGEKSYKIRIDKSNLLYVDDYPAGLHVYADHAYLTDKFIYFTVKSQVMENISYALSENGEVGVNTNGCLFENYRNIDGYLHATGGTEVGFERWDNKDLIIKFIDNTLIVTYAK